MSKPNCIMNRDNGSPVDVMSKKSNVCLKEIDFCFRNSKTISFDCGFESIICLNLGPETWRRLTHHQYRLL